MLTDNSSYQATNVGPQRLATEQFITLIGFLEEGTNLRAWLGGRPSLWSKPRKGDGGVGTGHTKCVIYTVLASIMKKNTPKKTGVAETAWYPDNLYFDGDEHFEGRRGAEGVYS